MNNINDVATKTFGATMKPVLEFNNFFVKTSETTFTKQVKCYKAYIKLGMENVNEGLKVRTFKDMVDYTEKQSNIVKKTTDMFVTDAKSFTELNNRFIEEAHSLMETSVKTSVTAVNEAVRSVT